MMMNDDEWWWTMMILSLCCYHVSNTKFLQQLINIHFMDNLSYSYIKVVSLTEIKFFIIRIGFVTKETFTRICIGICVSPFASLWSLNFLINRFLWFTFSIQFLLIIQRWTWLMKGRFLRNKLSRQLFWTIKSFHLFLQRSR